MAERLGRRMFVQSLRSMRASNTGRITRAPVARRGMSSSASEGKKSDRPWQIVSGTVTIAGVAYLLTPPGKTAAHHTAAAHHPEEESHKPASSEGGAARGEKFTKGESSSVPSTPTPVEDDEGTKADAGEVKESMLQGYKADSPKDAKHAEEGTAPDSTDDKVSSTNESKSSERFNDGAPGMSDTGDKPEQKEKPSQETKRTTSTGESDQASMGEARAQAKGENAPKQMAEKTEDEDQ